MGNSLTENQQALVNLIADGGHEIRKCTSGFALWKRGIKWSQGRTPSNAISHGDVDHLFRIGFLTDDGHGAVEPAYALFAAAQPDPRPRWKPANEGYEGPAFTSADQK